MPLPKQTFLHPKICPKRPKLSTGMSPPLVKTIRPKFSARTSVYILFSDSSGNSDHG